MHRGIPSVYSAFFFVCLFSYENNSIKGGVVLMYNPIRLNTGTEKDFVMFQDYVRSVTDRGSYNSVSFLANSNIRGKDAPLVSVMCFENDIGINFKKLTEHTKGRFVTIFAEVRYFDGKKSYKAVGISLAPKEFKEETHIVDDNEVQPDFDEYEQLAFDFVNDEVGMDE